jgi:hypothetical protein
LNQAVANQLKIQFSQSSSGHDSLVLLTTLLREIGVKFFEIGDRVTDFQSFFYRSIASHIHLWLDELSGFL